MSSTKKRLHLFEIFRSTWCKIVFALSLVLVYVLMPKQSFTDLYVLLGGVFLLSTSVLLTCVVYSLKERAISARDSGASIGGVVAATIGMGALQLCGITAPACGASVGLGIAAILFPGAAMHAVEMYGILIVVLSILLQIVALYFLGCFKMVHARRVG